MNYIISLLTSTEREKACEHNDFATLRHEGEAETQFHHKLHPLGVATYNQKGTHKLGVFPLGMKGMYPTQSIATFKTCICKTSPQNIWF